MKYLLDEIEEYIDEQNLNTFDIDLLVSSIHELHKKKLEEAKLKDEVLDSIPLSIHEAYDYIKKGKQILDILNDNILEKKGWRVSFSGSSNFRIWHFEKSNELPTDTYYDVYFDIYNYDIVESNISNDDLAEVTKLLGLNEIKDYEIVKSNGEKE